MAEKEYIDRQEAIDSLLGWAAQLTETYGKNDEYVKCLESAAYNIEQIPAADVRPVVLCLDCEWYDGKPWKNNETGICARTDVGVRKDDFCSYGEKLEEN